MHACIMHVGMNAGMPACQPVSTSVRLYVCIVMSCHAVLCGVHARLLLRDRTFLTTTP